VCRAEADDAAAMGRLDGMVAFVTGGGSGIGRATARRFGREGAAVVVAEVDEASGRAAEEEGRAEGHDTCFVRTDVTDAASVRAAVDAAVAAHGRIDVLFNCAGGSLADDGPVTDVDMALWEPTMAVNVRGTMLCCRLVIPHMTGGRSSIVNMSSICGLSGNHPLHLYAAAKGAIVAFTRVLANQYWRQGVRANAIAPGVVLTDRVAGRWTPEAAAAMGFDTHPYAAGTPDDMAAIVLFLASEESRMINGATIPAEGGLTAY
jgi:NAD(P)-dependent dehydrogenase (short-subunit alcohol dehydrogenase family)